MPSFAIMGTNHERGNAIGPPQPKEGIQEKSENKDRGAIGAQVRLE